ncbi:MAG TPA: hypothetical protein VJR89_02325, partial [Polyangiales bacterium]|nr:hypothetical protein [Polyangiales bacterium]
MHRRPTRGSPATTVSGQETGGIADPNFRGNIVEPFLVSGGAVEFLNFDGGELSAAAAGVQLVCAFYVPPGRVGFLKELYCCPLVPPELGEVTVPNAWAQYVGDGDHQFVRASERAGYYRTPLAWAAAFDPTDEGGAPASWHWQLVLMDGNVLAKRPAFAVANPDSWYLSPGPAVPASAYPQGFPGSTLWPPQPVQVAPEQTFETHVVIPPNTTIGLFARWTQVQFNPTYVVTNLTADP